MTAPSTKWTVSTLTLTPARDLSQQHSPPVFRAMDIAQVLEQHDRWQDHHDTWLIAECTQYPPLFTTHSDKANTDFNAPVDWFSDDATIVLTATVDNFGKVNEEEEETAETPHISQLN
ncbi:hypothetical protein ACA910_012518 [Epithemia clementina (nom. ined.)]